MKNFLLNDLFLLPLPKQRPEHIGKVTVVLDLDETLIHSIFLRDLEVLLRGNGGKASKIVKKMKKKSDLFLTDVGRCGDIAVFFRPGLHRFLSKLSKTCEVVLWTASNRKYAKPILDYIDPDGELLPYRLFRKHTIERADNELVKDLSKLGRDMKRTVLIDNNPRTLDRAPRNVYLIPDFYGDPNDTELSKAWGFLSEACDLYDIRHSLELALSMVTIKNHEEPTQQWVWKKVFINKTQYKYQKVLSTA